MFTKSETFTTHMEAPEKHDGNQLGAEAIGRS